MALIINHRHLSTLRVPTFGAKFQKLSGCSRKLKTFLAGKGCEVDRALDLSAKIIEGWSHRDRTRASTLCFFILFYFSTFEHVKSLLIMGPSSTKKCDFLIMNHE